MSEKYGLQPAQVWDSFYIFNNSEPRLAPRPAQARLEYLNEVVERVGRISPSLQNWLIHFVTGRWRSLPTATLTAEDELAWRRRTWNESQLYDHRNATPEHLVEYAEHYGPDPYRRPRCTRGTRAAKVRPDEGTQLGARLPPAALLERASSG